MQLLGRYLPCSAVKMSEKLDNYLEEGTTTSPNSTGIPSGQHSIESASNRSTSSPGQTYKKESDDIATNENPQSKKDGFWRTVQRYVWDDPDKPEHEKKFLLKLDFFLLTYTCLGYFCKVITL